jgi:hypothetical protein
MGFDARFVSKLDYDFTAIGLNIKGVSPDPSDDAVFDFQMRVKDAASALGQGDDFDPNDQQKVMEFMNNLTREDFKKVNSIIFDALAELLDNRPSREELDQIASKSYRHSQAYIGSVMGDVMDPKIVKNVSKL